MIGRSSYRTRSSPTGVSGRAATLAAILLTLNFSGPALAADPLAPTGRWTANLRGAAATPPMGWNSWNAFRTEVDEAKVLGAAKALVDTGLSRIGYVYVNIDDGWWLKRRQSDGRLQVRTAIFPSAKTGGREGTSFRPFVDKVHSMGLKAGIYSEVGRNACSQAFDLHSPNLPEGTTLEREVGLFGHVDKDIRLFFKEWGFDYIKVDACGIANYGAEAPLVAKYNYRPFEPILRQGSPSQTDIPAVRKLFQEVSDSLARHNSDDDYVYSVVAWGEADVRNWGKDVGNLWRTSGDITPSWTRMLHTFDSAASRPLYAQPGSWNDPDMLFIGAGDFDANHLREARSHFSLWSIINAPLLIGYDLRKAPQSLLDIWGNAEVVAVNQDPGGHQGVIAYDSDDLQIIVKTLSGSDRKAVLLFNRGARELDATLTAGHLKFAPDVPIKLKDLWSKSTLAPFLAEQTFKLAPRETRMFVAEGRRALAGGYYLSEIPGAINVAEDGVQRPEVDPTIHQMISPWAGSRSSGERPGYTGWGGAQADVAPYGTAIQVSGRKFESGLGVLAGSRLEVRNDQGFKAFSAAVGIDDATRNASSPVRFFVYGDGRLLAETSPLSYGQEATNIKADTTGVKIIELVARQLGAPPAPVSVAWGDAALIGR